MTIFGVEIEGDHTFSRESVERYTEQAYKAGQEDERAKIVYHIRQVADRIENDPDGKVWGHLQAMAIVIMEMTSGEFSERPAPK
jgi:hypothetical protein